MELTDKMKREQELLQNLIQADEEDKKIQNNDYFAKTKSNS